MSPTLKPGLTPETASHICMSYCRAMCCRGALVLRLSEEEIAAFEDHARSFGIEVVKTQPLSGGAWVRFSDHPGERCPMLDAATNACRIYDNRPQRCRDFPEKPTPGCPISGG